MALTRRTTEVPTYTHQYGPEFLADFSHPPPDTNAKSWVLGGGFARSGTSDEYTDGQNGLTVLPCLLTRFNSSKCLLLKTGVVFRHRLANRLRMQ